MVGFFLDYHHSLEMGILNCFVFNDNNPLEGVHLHVMPN